MRILAVAGSMRDGNTKRMIDEAVNHIHNMKYVNVKKVHLKDISMQYCNGCLMCDETGTCFWDDDMKHIADDVRNIDGFIFASPARWSLLSGEMKTFLDRLNPLAVNDELRGKKCVIFVVGQSEEDDSQSIQTAAKSISDFCNNAGIDVVGTVIACGCYASDDISNKNECIEKCRRMSQRLVENINREE